MAKLRALYFIFCCAIINNAFPQLSFDDNFDNGHLGIVTQNGNLYTLEATAFLHFRISGVLNQSPEFRVDQGNDYIFRNDHRMIFRAGDDTIWHYFDNGYVSGSYYYFNHSTPFAADTIYIAYWYPWTFGQMVDYMAEIANHPFVRNDSVRGYSVQNRPIYGFEVTDPAVPDSLKEHVVIVARQHSNESLGSHIIRGMSDYLIYSNDSTAIKLRQKTIHHFYPMGNPDGVYLGEGYGGTPYLNLNRYWYYGTPSGGSTSPCIETDVLRQAIWDDTGGSAAYCFDLHSHPGHIGQYYWWGLLSGPTPQMVQAAQELVQRINFHDAADHGGVSIVAGQIVQDVWASPGPYADYWFVETLGGVGYTFEAGSVPPQNLERITEVGVAFCKGLNDVIEGSVITKMDSKDKRNAVAATARLYVNYPNPFNNITNIQFEIASISGEISRFVSLKIYDIIGREVATLVAENLPPGDYKYAWDATGMASGLYFYRLETRDFSKTMKLFLLK